MTQLRPQRLVRLAMLTSIALLAFSLWRKDVLPDPQSLDTNLFRAPLQTAIAKAPFQKSVGDIIYTVKPLFEYDLYGLVVSEHDATTFWDYVHREAGDRLNVTDLCVAWGDDARSGIYRKVQFSSGQFTCYFHVSDAATMAQFDIYQISNNHLLTEVPRIARVLRGVHIGDEVHFHGYLSEYEHDHGFHFHRGTSTTRFDTGDGACETVYVTDAEILRSHGRTWRVLMGCALAGFVVSVIAWLRLPATLDD